MSQPLMRGVAELAELDRIFAALGHQTRRAILLVLPANGGVMTSGAIAAYGRKSGCPAGAGLL